MIIPFLILGLGLHLIAADRQSLLNRMKDKSWPWFGDCYSQKCPAPQNDVTNCFNLKPGKAESVLERIGVTNVELTTDLEVSFASPAENVDVCGKAIQMPEVRPFKLDSNGLAFTNRLKLGAEIYRQPPKLSWTLPATTPLHLMLFDVGLFIVRGYWRKVKSDQGFTGEMEYQYRPPANPLPVPNPILILLLEAPASTNDDAYHSNPFTQACDATRPRTAAGAQTCIAALAQLQSDYKIRGMQVYYTDGSSNFEKFMACAEGYICHTACLDQQRQYAESEKSHVTFLDMNTAQLTMYVNVYYSAAFMDSKTSGCCGMMNSNAYTFRPRPGDNLKVDETIKIHLGEGYNPVMLVEVSGPESVYKEDFLYSVFFIGPVNGNEPPPINCLFSNFKITDQVIHMQPSQLIGECSGPTLSGMETYRLYHVLFQHTTQLSSLPEKTAGSKLFDKSKLPADFTLRAISWFLAGNDAFSKTNCNDPTPACPTQSEPPIPPPFSFTNPEMGTTPVDSEADKFDFSCGHAMTTGGTTVGTTAEGAATTTANARNTTAKSQANSVSANVKLVLLSAILLSLALPK
ncbi:uncharacterized protein LOC131955893 [Physella acuta]|uniref:uncharacterized protein LOC131955893 n=1 Tax=Physella acuta TaxID=109671 RepID=UPI0027DBAF21|nr:uncharacterized protein LOC131955893 [Physella acuta]